MNVRYIAALGIAFLPAAYATPAKALVVEYPNFTSTAGLTLAGKATTTATSDGTVLRLTGTGLDEAGAAFTNSPVTLGAGGAFSTQFQFRITAPGGIDPADGFAFLLAANPTGLGGGGVSSGGGFLGYGGVPNSVAIEFDTFNNGGVDGNSSNHVAIDENGHVIDGTSFSDQNLTNVYAQALCDFTSANSYSRAGCLSNGDLWTALITYDGTNLNLNLTDPAEGSTDSVYVNLPINISSFLGTNTPFVGFGAGTGGGVENHDIINWEFATTADLPAPASPTPEPATLAVLGAALAAMGMRSIRRRKTG
jgi:hypothetical protein